MIIINTDFIRGPRLPGGKKDEEKLLELFTALRFDVKIHQNLTGEEIFYTVKSYGARQHSGAFFLIILSHGKSVHNRPAVIGTDDTAVVVDDLQCFFHSSNCSSLHGKPKIFLIDACRGSQQERIFNPVSMTTKKSSASLLHQNYPYSVATRSDLADFLIIYAATDGYVAFATPQGSFLTQTFVKVASEADETDSLQDIITRVRREVQYLYQYGLQTVESTDRLTRKYLIKRYSKRRETRIYRKLLDDRYFAYCYSSRYCIMIIRYINFSYRRPTIQELQTQFNQQVQRWIPVRDGTIDIIEKTIEQLKKHHKKVNIARIAGSGTSAIGSGVAIAGFILAPFTAGLSIGLSVGGIAVATLGGGTAAGASLADAYLQKENIKHVQDQLARDNKQLEAISQTARKIKKEIDDTRQKYPDVSTVAEFGRVFTVTQGVARAGNAAVKLTELGVHGTMETGALALRVGGAAAKSIAAAGIVLNVILIPIDLAEILRSGFSLITGSQTEAIKQLTDIVEKLKKQKKAIKDLTKR